MFEELARLLNQRFEPVLLSPILQELKTMAEKGSPSRRKQASLALKLAEKCSIIDIEKNRDESNDNVILRVANLWNSPVATNDQELRNKLRARNIPVIHLRGKNQLELEGVLSNPA